MSSVQITIPRNLHRRLGHDDIHLENFNVAYAVVWLKTLYMQPQMNYINAGLFCGARQDECLDKLLAWQSLNFSNQLEGGMCLAAMQLTSACHHPVIQQD